MVRLIAIQRNCIACDSYDIASPACQRNRYNRMRFERPDHCPPAILSIGARAEGTATPLASNSSSSPAGIGMLRK